MDGNEVASGVLEELGITEAVAEMVDGCVHVHGQAGCYRTKRLAEERIIAALPGVCVTNQIRVARSDAPDDPAIAALVSDAIAATPGAAGRVTVNVRDGVVHLYGAVTTAEQRRHAETAAWEQDCVSEVRSHISVAELNSDDADVGSLLEAYAQRSLNLPPGRVTVHFQAGVAALRGTVTSLAQAEALEDLIRWHDHVDDVVNELRVVQRIDRTETADLSA